MKDMKGIDEKVMLMWKWWEHEMAGIDTTIDDQDIPWLQAERELQQILKSGDDFALDVLLRIIALAPPTEDGDDSYISISGTYFFSSFWDNASESVKLRAHATSASDKRLWAVMHYLGAPE